MYCGFLRHPAVHSFILTFLFQLIGAVFSNGAMWSVSDTGADPAIGGQGDRLPLTALLLLIYCTKMHEIWSVDSQDNY